MEESLLEIAKNFDEMQAVVDAVSMGMSISELHGYQAGLACLGLKFEASDWWDLLQLDYPAGSSTDVEAEDQEVLYASFISTSNGLESGDFSFQLLLPDDDDSLVARVSALSDWCAGFFSGVQRGVTLVEEDVSTIIQSNEIILELLKDIEAIRQADRLELAEPEDFAATENDYAEICEYVRMAALNIFLELGVAVTEIDSNGDAQGSLETPPKPQLH